MMITFDKIKLVTKVENISILDSKMFEKKINYLYGTTSYCYNQKQPFNLFIKITPNQDEAILEFSSKILKDNYHQMISLNTIYNCLMNINNMGFCEINIERIIHESQMINCDITKDINIKWCDNLLLLLTAFLKDYKKFHIQKYKTGYTATKEVKTKWRQLRLSIYNKHIEINSAKNEGFRNTLSNKEEMMVYFKDKFRIETNLKTLKQIRKYFNTDDITLHHLLNSNENPLLNIFDIFFDVSLDNSNSPTNSGLFAYKSMKQLGEALILEKFNNDIGVVSII